MRAPWCWARWDSRACSISCPTPRCGGATPSWAGLLAGIAFELGKRGFAAYLLQVPTYKTVYGAFAALPAFLLWVYFSWLVTLTAALVAATQPKVSAGRRLPGARRQRAAG